eukprot:93139-Pleurochrysis_carterae.AAC.2
MEAEPRKTRHESSSKCDHCGDKTKSNARSVKSVRAVCAWSSAHDSVAEGETEANCIEAHEGGVKRCSETRRRISGGRGGREGRADNQSVAYSYGLSLGRRDDALLQALVSAWQVRVCTLRARALACRCVGLRRVTCVPLSESPACLTNLDPGIWCGVPSERRRSGPRREMVRGSSAESASKKRR